MYTDKVQGDICFALFAGGDRVTCIRFKTLDFGPKPKPESHKKIFKLSRSTDGAGKLY